MTTRLILIVLISVWIMLCPDPSSSDSLFFDGNSEVLLPSDISPVNITIETWFKLSALDDPSWVPFITKETGSGRASEFSWRLGIETERPERAPLGSLMLHVSNRDTTVWIHSSTIPIFDEWYHVAGTYDGSIMRLYVNGILEGEGFETYPGDTWAGGILNQNDLPTAIGHLPGWGIQYYQGYLDEMRIWDYARSTDQIISTKDAALSGSEFGLLSYWDFEQGINSAILYDETINNYDGFINNAQWSIDSAPLSSAPIPEPSTILLLGTGLLGVIGIARRRKS